jgi:hypothetical protein
MEKLKVQLIWPPELVRHFQNDRIFVMSAGHWTLVFATHICSFYLMLKPKQQLSLRTLFRYPLLCLRFVQQVKILYQGGATWASGDRFLMVAKGMAGRGRRDYEFDLIEDPPAERLEHS